MQVFYLIIIYLYSISITCSYVMFACQIDAPALGSGQQKIGSGSTLKVAAPAPQHWSFVLFLKFIFVGRFHFLFY